MENINWAVTLITGALISIPIGIFVNLITPKTQNWVSKYSVKIRGSNITRLEQEVSESTFYLQNPTLIYIPILSRLLLIFIVFSLGLDTLFLGIVFQIIPMFSTKQIEIGNITLLGSHFMGIITGVLGIILIFISTSMATYLIYSIDKYTYLGGYIGLLQKRIKELKNQ